MPNSRLSSNCYDLPTMPATLVAPSLPADWMQRLAGIVVIPPHAESLDKFHQDLMKHIGPSSTFRMKDTLRTEIQAIYAHLQDDHLDKDSKIAIGNKLTEGIELCTPGFHNRIIELHRQLNKPETLDGLLSDMREGIMMRALRADSKGEPDVHVNNQYTIVAHDMGYGIRPLNAQDFFSNNRNDDQIRAALTKAFTEHYHIPSILNECIVLLSSNLNALGYVGNKLSPALDYTLQPTAKDELPKKYEKNTIYYYETEDKATGPLFFYRVEGHEGTIRPSELSESASTEINLTRDTPKILEIIASRKHIAQGYTHGEFEKFEKYLGKIFGECTRPSPHYTRFDDDENYNYLDLNWNHIKQSLLTTLLKGGYFELTPAQKECLNRLVRKLSPQEEQEEKAYQINSLFEGKALEDKIVGNITGLCDLLNYLADLDVADSPQLIDLIEAYLQCNFADNDRTDDQIDALVNIMSKIKKCPTALTIVKEMHGEALCSNARRMLEVDEEGTNLLMQSVVHGKPNITSILYKVQFLSDDEQMRLFMQQDINGVNALFYVIRVFISGYELNYNFLNAMPDGLKEKMFFQPNIFGNNFIHIIRELFKPPSVENPLPSSQKLKLKSIVKELLTLVDPLVVLKGIDDGIKAAPDRYGEQFSDQTSYLLMQIFKVTDEKSTLRALLFEQYETYFQKIARTLLLRLGNGNNSLGQSFETSNEEAINDQLLLVQLLSDEDKGQLFSNINFRGENSLMMALKYRPRFVEEVFKAIPENVMADLLLQNNRDGKDVLTLATDLAPDFVLPLLNATNPLIVKRMIAQCISRLSRFREWEAQVWISREDRQVTLNKLKEITQNNAQLHDMISAGVRAFERFGLHLDDRSYYEKDDSRLLLFRTLIGEPQDLPDLIQDMELLSDKEKHKVFLQTDTDGLDVLSLALKNNPKIIPQLLSVMPEETRERLFDRVFCELYAILTIPSYPEDAENQLLTRQKKEATRKLLTTVNPEMAVKKIIDSINTEPHYKQIELIKKIKQHLEPESSLWASLSQRQNDIVLKAESDAKRYLSRNRDDNNVLMHTILYRPDEIVPLLGNAKYLSVQDQQSLFQDGYKNALKIALQFNPQVITQIYDFFPEIMNNLMQTFLSSFDVSPLLQKPEHVEYLIDCAIKNNHQLDDIYPFVQSVLNFFKKINDKTERISAEKSIKNVLGRFPDIDVLVSMDEAIDACRNSWISIGKRDKLDKLTEAKDRFMEQPNPPNLQACRALLAPKPSSNFQLKCLFFFGLSCGVGALALTGVAVLASSTPPGLLLGAGLLGVFAAASMGYAFFKRRKDASPATIVELEKALAELNLERLGAGYNGSTNHSRPMFCIESIKSM